jgi:hypothetical protein
MIVRTKVIEALERKRAPFQAYLEQQERVGARARTALAQFLQLSAEEIDARLAARETEHAIRAGARPTAELDLTSDLCLPFGEVWENQQEARAWALRTLTNRPVAAVDGSQIAPAKEISLAVGALQIGWYVNYHAQGGKYIKDVDFEVITPGELEPETSESDRTGGSTVFPDWYLNQQRFVRECEKIADLMLGWPEQEQKPLFLFDGSFVISFAGQMLPERARPYIDAVTGLLEISKTTRIPVVAFIDSSYSRDLAALIDWMSNDEPRRGLTDARLLDDQLPHWGDRSPLFWCDRDDTLSREGNGAFYRDVAFCYLRLTGDGDPVRVEMPRWMVEDGVAEDALCLVRAEAVVGNGYPWALETADALAVLRMEDRERFLQLFEQFARQYGLGMQRTTKMQSKLMRRPAQRASI